MESCKMFIGRLSWKTTEYREYFRVSVRFYKWWSWRIEPLAVLMALVSFSLLVPVLLWEPYCSFTSLMLNCKFIKSLLSHYFIASVSINLLPTIISCLEQRLLLLQVKLSFYSFLFLPMFLCIFAKGEVSFNVKTWAPAYVFIWVFCLWQCVLNWPQLCLNLRLYPFSAWLFINAMSWTRIYFDSEAAAGQCYYER